MLIPDTTHPEKTIFYNGALVLEIILRDRVVDFLELYHQASNLRHMSMAVFVLCLDWLFLLGVVSMEDDGKVKLCS